MISNESIIKDPSLAPSGERKIQWVDQHSPLLNALREKYLNKESIGGLKIGIIVPLEAKTGFLATVLADAGAEVVVTGTGPAYVQDDVAAALVARGLRVYAISGVSDDEFRKYLEKVLEFQPDVLIDDRAEFVRMLHTDYQHLLSKVRGASEQTTSGVTRLLAMQEQGVLKLPVIAANNAMCKHFFDNRYGTGQSVWTAIMSATNLFIAGREVVVIGYGWCGKGLARRAKGLGARVTVVEVDPVKGLEAWADGFEVHPLEKCASYGDIFVTSTGSPHAIDTQHIEQMKDGAILANAGGLDDEINVKGLEALAKEKREARRYITEYVLPDGRRIHLLADGFLVNLVAGDGHPVEIIDMTFAVQALGMRHVALHYDQLGPGVHDFPKELDEEIARLKLKSLGMGVGSLTKEQINYLHSWR